MSAEERRSAEPFDRNHRPADSSRVHDAQIREETAHDASTQATSILNQLISNLPSVPKSRDELLQQIAVVEKNLGGFYGDLVNEGASMALFIGLLILIDRWLWCGSLDSSLLFPPVAERTYPSQVETLRRIRNEAIEKIDAIRHNLTPALEQAREQVGNIGKWPG